MKSSQPLFKTVSVGAKMPGFLKTSIEFLRLRGSSEPVIAVVGRLCARVYVAEEPVSGDSLHAWWRLARFG